MNQLDKYGVPYVNGIKGLRFACTIDGLNVSTQTFNLEMKNNQKIAGEFTFNVIEDGVTFDDVYAYVKNVKNKTIKIQHFSRDNELLKESILTNVEITKVSQSISFLQNAFFDFPVDIVVKFSADLDV